MIPSIKLLFYIFVFGFIIQTHCLYASNSVYSDCDSLDFLCDNSSKSDIIVNLHDFKSSFNDIYSELSREYNELNKKCFSLLEFEYEERKAMACLSSWIGNKYDIWIIYFDQNDETVEKPLFSGFSLFNLFGVSEESIKLEGYVNSLNGNYYIDEIEHRVIGNELIIEMFYKRIQRRNIKIFEKSDLLNESIIINLAEIRDDNDLDNMTDLIEKRIGTDPFNNDTDIDGILDSVDQMLNDTSSEESPMCNIYRNIILEYNYISEYDNLIVYFFPAGVECNSLTQNVLALNRYYPHIISYKSLRFLEHTIDENKMVIKVVLTCGALCGDGSEIHLEKTDGEWTIIEKKQYLYF